MKTFLKILCIGLCTYFSLGMFGLEVFATQNLRDFEPSTNKEQDTSMLDAFFNPNSDKVVNEVGGNGIRDFLLKLAKDGKNVVFAFATIALLVLVFRLLFTNNTEEEKDKFKKGLFWIVLGIVLMQLSYSAVSILFDEQVDEALARDFVTDLLGPIIDILLFGASFAFLFVGILAFFMMITANGDEEKTKKGKQTVGYAVIGFVVVKFADLIVSSAYTATYNEDGSTETGLIDLMARGMNWVTSFLGIVIVLMIMYTGVQVIFGSGDEEKLKKARRSIVYIGIGLLILVANYLIATFFIRPEGVI